MSEVKLTKTRLFEGVWEGVLSGGLGGSWQPKISVTHLEKAVPNVEVLENRDQGNWIVRIPVPVSALTDGVHTILIRNTESGETLASFAVLAGDALSEDIRGEMELLREELDMLKRAFRRHCIETM